MSQPHTDTTNADLDADRWAMPAARVLLPADAPRGEWLAMRRRGIGGSDASTVVGLNPHRSLLALWLDKHGLITDKGPTLATEWGLRLEPVISAWFTDTTGIPVQRAGLARSLERDWQQVSLDGLAGDGGNCEWKSTSWRTEDAEVWRDGEVPDHAEVQAQHGLAVTGRSHAHVVVLIDGRYPIHRVVERDEQLIGDITALESAFWHDHVLPGLEPPADGRPSTTDALRRRYPNTVPGRMIAAGPEVGDIADQLLAAKQAVTDAEATRDWLENQLRQIIGDAELLAVHGYGRATLKQNGTFSVKRFAADHPELHEQLLTGAPAFDLPRLKTEHPDLYAEYRARVLRVPANPKPVKEN